MAELPFFEEEIGEEVLAEWRKEGLDPAVTEENYLDYFGLDRLVTIPVRFSPVEGAIKGKEDLARALRHYGEHPVKFLKASYWKENAEEFRGRDFPLGLVGWNGFQLPLFPPDPRKEQNEWENLVNLYYLLKDSPQMVAEALDFIADYYIEIAALACRFLDFDFALLSEPIASARGPVISPRDFGGLVLPQYRKLVRAYRELGIPKVVFSSISNVKALLPLVVEAGVDGLWITQIMNAGLDYVQIGGRFPRLGLIGGIESVSLLEGAEAIAEEVRRKAVPLLRRGRWLPALDDNVRANIPYRSFLAYRRALEGYCRGGGLGHLHP